MHDRDVTVSVDDEARQVVRFRMHEPAGVMPGVEEPRPARHGALELRREERPVDAIGGLEGPHARADLRFRRVRAPAEHRPVVGEERDRLA